MNEVNTEQTEIARTIESTPPLDPPTPKRDPAQDSIDVARQWYVNGDATLPRAAEWLFNQVPGRFESISAAEDEIKG